MGFWIYGRIPFTPIRYTGRIGLPRREPTRPEMVLITGLVCLFALGGLLVTLLQWGVPTWVIGMGAFLAIVLGVYLTVVRPIMKAPYVRDLEPPGDSPAAHSDRR
jgi:hypothetical protein